jgi:plasmid stabilization system protein ParE
MRYRFHLEALEDYQEAANWYSQRGSALALRFVNSIEEGIWRASQTPERWTIIEEDIHRCLTHVFPYGILYTIESDYVLIVAVMHCSRKPGYWRHRLANDEALD